MATRFFGGLLDPKDISQLSASLTRRTRIVMLSKHFLVILAIALVALVFIIPALQDDTGGARIVFTQLQSGEAEQPHMTNPHFQGLDAKNQPYHLQAKMAQQQDDGTILLNQVSADITLAGGTWLAFLADTGILNLDHNTLFLPEHVSLFHDKGYELRATAVTVQMKKAHAATSRPVEAQGPLGTLEADGMEVNTEAEIIRFAPRVKVVLQPQGKKR